MSRIAILLTPGFADWEYGLIAGTGGPFYGLDIRFFGTSPGAVTSQGGLTTTISEGLGDLVSWQPDVMVVIGGTVWESTDAPDLGAVLTGLHDRGAAIAGICGGTLALARSGLLDQVRHTSNHQSFLAENANNYAGADYYEESAAAISDMGVITAPGTAPASFAAAVFEAAGLAQATVEQFKGMMAVEHS